MRKAKTSVFMFYHYSKSAAPLNLFVNN